ncbi:MAG: cytochrome P450 [Paracoccaceae bacterium]
MHPDFNAMTSARFREDPWPVLAHMREHHPVAHLAPGLVESWHIFRQGDVMAVLNDTETFSSNRALQSASVADANLGFLFNNLISASGDKHRRLRMIGNRAFLPRFVEALRPALEAVVEDRMAMALGGQPFDMVEEFAAPITVAMIAGILGLPRSDMPMIRRWTAVLGDNSGASTWLDAPDPAMAERGRATGLEMTGYFRDFLARPLPEGSILAALQAVEVDGQRLDPDEVLSMAMLLLLAGNETTTNLITNFVRMLDAHPDAAARLRQNPERADNAVEELLRMRSSIRNIDRFATRDVAMHGVTIPAGGLVVVWLSAANRDPEVFDAPDDFRPERHPNPHLAFGHGLYLPWHGAGADGNPAGGRADFAPDGGGGASGTGRTDRECQFRQRDAPDGAVPEAA